MAVTTGYIYSDRDLEVRADHVKALVVKALVEDKLLDEKAAEAWCLNNTIIIRKEALFKTLIKKWFTPAQKTDDESSFYIVVKQAITKINGVKEK